MPLAFTQEDFLVFLILITSLTMHASSELHLLIKKLFRDICTLIHPEGTHQFQTKTTISVIPDLLKWVDFFEAFSLEKVIYDSPNIAVVIPFQKLLKKIKSSQLLIRH